MESSSVDARVNDRHPTDAARAAIEMLTRRVGETGDSILTDRLKRIGSAYKTGRMAWAYPVEGTPDVVARCRLWLS
jgi:hypothetical protein